MALGTSAVGAWPSSTWTRCTRRFFFLPGSNFTLGRSKTSVGKNSNFYLNFSTEVYVLVLAKYIRRFFSSSLSGFRATSFATIFFWYVILRNKVLSVAMRISFYCFGKSFS